MGHYADMFPYKTEKEQQKVYLNTGAHPPFSRKYWFGVMNLKWQQSLYEKIPYTSTEIYSSKRCSWNFMSVRSMEYQHYLGKAEIIIELVLTCDLETLLNLVKYMMASKAL